MVRHILLWVVSGFFMFPWSVQLMGRRNYIFSRPPIFVYVCASMHPCMLGQRHYQLPCHQLVMKFKEYVVCRPEKTWLIFGRVVWANLLMILACIDRCMHSSECCVVAITITTTFSFCLTGVSHHAKKKPTCFCLQLRYHAADINSVFTVRFRNERHVVIYISATSSLH